MAQKTIQAPRQTWIQTMTRTTIQKTTLMAIQKTNQPLVQTRIRTVVQTMVQTKTRAMIQATTQSITQMMTQLVSRLHLLHLAGALRRCHLSSVPPTRRFPSLAASGLNRQCVPDHLSGVHLSPRLRHRRAGFRQSRQGVCRMKSLRRLLGEEKAREVERATSRLRRRRRQLEEAMEQVVRAVTVELMVV